MRATNPHGNCLLSVNPVYQNCFNADTVRNYVVFYVVKEQIVEIHRVIYAKMNLTKVLK